MGLPKTLTGAPVAPTAEVGKLEHDRPSPARPTKRKKQHTSSVHSRLVPSTVDDRNPA